MPILGLGVGWGMGIREGFATYNYKLCDSHFSQSCDERAL